MERKTLRRVTETVSLFVRLSGLGLAALVLACARQGFPPGGPVDRTPPQIVRTYPEQGAVRVPLDATIEIEFSERVRPGTVEDALFLSPAPLQPLKLKWKGKRLLIRVPGGLRPARTYVLTVGAGARDLRNNMMRESVLLAFSTGDSLDRGRISGSVWSADGPATGVLVAAYDLNEHPHPDPTRDGADYFSQTGEDGRFSLGFLRRSWYRVFAWDDRDANRLWSVGEEAVGVPWRDVSLLDSLSRGGVLLRLAALDTLAPRAVDARSPDSRHVDVRLSERADPKRSTGWSALVLDQGGKPVTLQVAFLDDRNPDRLHLVTGRELSGEFLLVLRGLTDAWGNRLEAD
ncbi:MAG: Ig-like domain-containing protein, partial [Calditrichaeota bacterium]|nr:Ig-like domain-containing protein [Calditrichota bacterium]